MQRKIKLLPYRLYKIYHRRRHNQLFYLFQRFTMIDEDTYNANLDLVKRFSQVPGAVVECGTWKGGMIAGMAALLGPERDYFLFDSFEGLPPAKEIDGADALRWQQNTTSPGYHDNCTASERDAHQAMQLTGVPAYYLAKGWFNQTLPNTKVRGGIAILRLDADWYDSTMDILKNLFDQVTPGGVILIDDYHTWDGCSRAVHDFLSANNRTERICEHEGVCYIVKKP